MLYLYTSGTSVVVAESAADAAWIMDGHGDEDFHQVPDDHLYTAVYQATTKCQLASEWVRYRGRGYIGPCIEPCIAEHEKKTAIVLNESQKPPDGDWRVWLIHARRRWGKNTAAIDWLRREAESMPGCAIAVVGLDPHFLIREIQNAAPRLRLDLRQNRVNWPNGSYARGLFPRETAAICGYLFSRAWIDQPRKCGEETFRRVQQCLRLGVSRMVLTEDSDWLDDLAVEKTTARMRPSIFAEPSARGPA